jgi:hypothetical protein
VGRCTDRSPVLLLPGLRVAGQQDARRGVGEEDGNRVVVGLGEELAWRWGYDVLKCATREKVKEEPPCWVSSEWG